MATRLFGAPYFANTGRKDIFTRFMVQWMRFLIRIPALDLLIFPTINSTLIMAFAITEIRNLSAGVDIYLTGDEKAFTLKDNFEKFTEGGNAPGATVSFTTKNDVGAIAGLKDVIQVTWEETVGNKKTARFAGGHFDKLNGRAFTISGLQDYSSVTVDFFGTIEIGPKPVNGQQAPGVAAISVRVGNNNPGRETIIDLSDGDKGDKSSLDLAGLIAWVSENGLGETTLPALPESTDANAGEKPDPKKFILDFNAFRFNVTRKAFRFEVESQDGQELKFSVFTLKKVGFLITNEPPKEEE
jgi:hypothetical protein